MPDCSCTHSSLPASSCRCIQGIGASRPFDDRGDASGWGTLRLRTAKRFRARYVHDFQPLECVEEQSCALL